MMAAIDPKVLLEQAEAELARRSLLAFGERVYADFAAPAHLEYIAGLLERVERGEIKRLLINLPMRHGKSLLCSSIFPAFFVGKNPRKNVIIATNSAELSERNSRIARSFLESDAWPFETKLSSDSTAVHRWNVRDGGGVYAVGVGGSITGRGGDVVVLDDIHHEEGSQGERDSTFEWYSSVLYPRLEPNGAIVLLGTRFAEDDTFGRVQEMDSAEPWTIVRLPGFAEEDDLLGRKPGAALWPARFSEAELNDRRMAMGQRAFESQVQQNPLPVSGNIIKVEWLSHRYTIAPTDLKITVALDAAAKTGLSNDYSVAIVLGSSKTKHYVLDVWRQRVDFPGLQRMLLAIDEKWDPSAYYVEDASSGTQLIQVLKAETKLPIVPVTPKGSKISRIEASTGQLEAGNVLLPDDHNAPPWLAPFLRELLAVPNAKHDDQADALALGLSKVAKRRGVYAAVISGDGSMWSSDDAEEDATRSAQVSEQADREFIARNLQSIAQGKGPLDRSAMPASVTPFDAYPASKHVAPGIY